LNWSVPPIHWLNDLENDPKYARWNRSLNYFLRHREVIDFGRNFLNLIYSGDPTETTGFFSLHGLLKDRLPARLGILPRFNLKNKLSKIVAYAFHHIARKRESLAVQFLLGATYYYGSDLRNVATNSLRESHFSMSYSNISMILPGLRPWGQLKKLFRSDSDESNRIRDMHETIAKLGLPREIMMLNGKPLSLQRNAPTVESEIRRMIAILQNSIRAKKLKDSDQVNVVKILAESHIVVPYLDNHILNEQPISLGLVHKTLSGQVAFLDAISSIEWNFTNSGKLCAYYVLFSQNQSEIDTFMEFAEQKHFIPSVFAVNPKLPERILNMFNLDISKTVLIANGRLLYDFTKPRLSILDKWLWSMVYSEVSESLETLTVNRNISLFYFSTIVVDWRAELLLRRGVPQDAYTVDSPLVFNSPRDEMNWDIMVDPFTRDFQRMSGLVEYVSRFGITGIRLIAAPRNKIPENLQTYYRNALGRERAVFTMLNDTTTYSAMPDMPESWIFESMKAVLDLDNILLTELTPSVHRGTYVLTNLKVEGQCGVGAENFADGAELALFDVHENRKSDTIVMRSLGYWQLAANPGEFTIKLGGKNSKLIYQPISHRLVISSFAQQFTRLEIAFNPGMEGLKVFNLSVHETWNTTSVNVFSVASGHLYERLLKIMMLAVRRKSQFDVKFWIIKNFLSPQFKATLPKMAAQYNFKYQLVGYRWPVWLYPQVEKQRIIWGNKILFLDVLFPLELDRVIYVDSDQVVRTDLIDLMRMDFEGAPYAFTPFCDSRRETEPFRFWKQGYWQSLLAGKKYHISALFAIDLPRFRQLGAGDWLRYHYQALAPDPKSLANLDQDLPNFVQTHIPIYSLPQEWLWCETWCSDETLAKAKTIDLCNNPLTKKPKLFVAQTMIKEWPALDEEVRNISAGADEYEKFFFPN
jgi:UDP-glucose:glycoprotein glucosyltransferase